MNNYDSTRDTLEHIGRVRGYLADCAIRLVRRAFAHDASKLESPEKEAFDEVTPLLRGLTYGSDEYKANIAKLGEALGEAERTIPPAASARAEERFAALEDAVHRQAQMLQVLWLERERRQ